MNYFKKILSKKNIIIEESELDKLKIEAEQKKIEQSKKEEKKKEEEDIENKKIKEKEKESLYVLNSQMKDYNNRYNDYYTIVNNYIETGLLNSDYLIKQSTIYLRGFFELISKLFDDYEYYNKADKQITREIILSDLMNNIVFSLKNYINIENFKYFYNYQKEPYTILVVIDETILLKLDFKRKKYLKIENQLIIDLSEKENFILNQLNEIEYNYLENERRIKNPLAFEENPLKTIKIMSNQKKYKKQIKIEINELLETQMQLKLELINIQEQKKIIENSLIEIEYFLERYIERLKKIGFKK